MMKDELYSFAKNCVICAAAGITISIAIKYFHNNGFSLDNIISGTNLNSYERKILSNSIQPSDLNFSTGDIVGQDELVQQIKNNVVIPIHHKDLFKPGQVDFPKGILFFGPPGCGKTMLAQAIAKELDVSFINIGLDSIQDKWYGETTKLVKAMFTLAKKIKPCVIFIDEIDSILASRSSEDHEATKGCKSTFLQLWDGLTNNENDGILIVGATNRKELIDEAFLSRFDYVYHLPLPSVEQRELYLRRTLADQTEPDFDFKELAISTKNHSFRDLKNLCKQAKSKRIPKDLEKYIKFDQVFNQMDNQLIDLPKLKLNDFKELLKGDKFSTEPHSATSSRYMDFNQD